MTTNFGGEPMETIRKHFKFGLIPLIMAFIITTIVPGLRTEARAGSGAAFLGGMLAGHIVGGAIRRSRIRTAAAVQAANQPRTQTVYVQQQPATTQHQAAAPPPASKPTVEQRLKELEELAKKGYITPEEYKARKKAIIDSI
jgi:hypothetical protein